MLPKPATVSVPPSARQNMLAVKFKQDRKMRAYGGHIYDMGAGGGAAPLDFTAVQPVLASLNAYWYPLHFKLSEPWLDAMRAQGEANAGQELPDLNTTMLVTVPTGYSAQDTANLINSVDEVEYVEPVSLPVPASPGDLSRFQDYLHSWSGASTRFSGRQASGINAEYVWSQFNTRGKLSNGTKINVAVIENDVNTFHLELSAATSGSGSSSRSNIQSDKEHGAAVASIIGGRNDSVGISGIASQVKLSLFFDGAAADSGDPVSEALDGAWNTVGAGGIINVSQAYRIFVKGNVNDGIPDRTVEFPLTYYKTYYDTILSINQAHTTVVLAAGNTGASLDYYDINIPIAHHPFTTDPSYPSGSGAIPGVIYAGASAVVSNVPLSRCDFSTSDPTNNSSNYGYVVALQGWGEYVEAAGEFYPGTGTDGNYSADGDNSAYTGGFNGTAAATPMVTFGNAPDAYSRNSFNGTAAATPMVTGALALLQAANLQAGQPLLTPLQLKTKLRKTGFKQAAGGAPNYHSVGEKIGTLPNLQMATAALPGSVSQSALAPQPTADQQASTPAQSYPRYESPNQLEP